MTLLSCWPLQGDKHASLSCLGVGPLCRKGPFCFCARVPMGDDETYTHLALASHLDMDDAFCARMRALAAGLESVPVGVITTPGTRNPKFVPTKQVVRFSQGGDF